MRVIFGGKGFCVVVGDGRYEKLFVLLGVLGLKELLLLIWWWLLGNRLMLFMVEFVWLWLWRVMLFMLVVDLFLICLFGIVYFCLLFLVLSMVEVESWFVFDGFVWLIVWCESWCMLKILFSFLCCRLCVLLLFVFIIFVIILNIVIKDVKKKVKISIYLWRKRIIYFIYFFDLFVIFNVGVNVIMSIIVMSWILEKMVW